MTMPNPPGQEPPATGVSMMADGHAQKAAQDMGSACEQAQTNATSHHQRNAGQLGMRVTGV